MEKRISKKEKIAFNIITAFVIMLLLLALMAPFIAPNDPNKTNLMEAQALPNIQYPLGTDHLGRCILSRILYGGRVSIFAALAITLTVFTVGVTIGVLAGYFGGPVDTTLNKLITIMQAFPKIILAIAIAGLLGIGIRNIIIALCMVEWAEYARMARSYTYSIKQRNFIKAARICGESHMKIIFKRIIPNIIFPLIINASLGISGIIMGVAALSYLGVGVKEPMAEWGAMVNTGRDYMQTDERLVLIPGIAIFITSAVFNLFGEKLRDKLSCSNN
jgi:ABC-type dipeptide/oligopeptide/nickel transport system permease subunit